MMLVVSYMKHGFLYMVDKNNMGLDCICLLIHTFLTINTFYGSTRSTVG